MSATEIPELARLIPEQDGGRYFWQDYVERLEARLDGLPAPDGEASFVRQCVASGERAVGVMRRNTLWEARAPDISERRERGVYELRIRLGLFFAGSLRCLVHGLSRLRVGSGDAPWHIWLDELVAGEVHWRPLMGGGGSFRDYLAACEGTPEITWQETAPTYAQACLTANCFFSLQESSLITPELTVEVMACVLPGRPRGLFGRMLVADGQFAEEEDVVDVAVVFLEALVEAVERKVLRVNTRANGHVFVTPEFWLLSTPVGLDAVRDFLRTRRNGRRYDFSRRDIYQALGSGGYLVTGMESTSGNAAWVCELEVHGWDQPLELKGLLLPAESLAAQPGGLPELDGTIKLQKENFGGRDKE